MKVAIYLRLIPQEKGVRAAGPDLLHLLRVRGWDLAGEYSELGPRGSKVPHSELDRLISDARKRKFDTLIIQRLSDLACDVRQGVHVLEKLRGLGIQLISLDDGIDTGTPSGAGSYRVVEGLVKLERDVLGEKIREGQARAVRAGRRVGRPASEINTEKVIDLHQSGMSVRRIAREVNSSKSRVALLLRKASTRRPGSAEVSQPPTSATGIAPDTS